MWRHDIRFFQLASFAFAIVLASACSKSESAPAKQQEATPPAVAPSPAPAVVPSPAPAVAPSPHEPGEPVITWKAGGRDFVVTMDDYVDEMRIHLTSSGQSFDLDVKNGIQSVVNVVDGRVVYQALDRTANGAFVYRAARIEWDTSAAKPVIAKKWTCREDGKTCVPPAWVGKVIEPAEGLYE